MKNKPSFSGYAFPHNPIKTDSTDQAIRLKPDFKKAMRLSKKIGGKTGSAKKKNIKAWCEFLRSALNVGA